MAINHSCHVEPLAVPEIPFGWNSAAAMPVDTPLGTFRNGRWAGYRLTTGDRYLIVSAAEDEALRLLSLNRSGYWSAMAGLLVEAGVPWATPENAWRAFAD